MSSPFHRGISRVPKLLGVLALTLALAACDTAQERAERHYQAGLEYLQEGDVDRALVEFRNVFKLNGEHRDARIAYAQAERARGNLREAFSQYLRLVEQYPDDEVGLIALAQMSADNGQWQDADGFLDTALTARPDDAELQALRVFVDYGLAVEANNSAGIVAAVDAAQAMRTAQPDSLYLRKLIIDDMIRAQRLDDALAELDAAVAAAPDEQVLYAQRLSVNAALGNDAAVEAGLKEMIARFPDAVDLPDALYRWYISRRELDKAEAYLRQRADEHPGETAYVAAVVRFLGEYRGTDAALAELDAAIARGDNDAVFRSARAGFHFDQGDQAGAIAEMEAILADAPDSEDARMIRVALARMQMSVGDDEAARALIESVLAEDSGNVEAVKLKANWLIMDDQPAEAVALLRDSIDQNPRDATLMTLMAQAYERDGNHGLMRDTLAQAVNVSGRAPRESLNYAQFLVNEGNLIAAEGVLIDALRIAPGDPTLLGPLGQVYVRMQDWPRAEAVVKELQSLDLPDFAGAIAALQTEVLAGQQKSDEALSYLQGLAAGEDAGLDAKIAVLQNHLANGRLPEAAAYADELVADDPDNLDLQYIAAEVQASVGNGPEAERRLREIVAADPARPAAWMGIFRITSADPARAAETAQVLNDALAANPDAPELLWARAGLLETTGDIEGAIAIYERLYQENSANPIVANNLASLLSNYRTDEESLKRAEIIARRLRGSDVPAYADTFGWIAYQNANYPVAVDELEKAVAGLPGDPTVHYHLGMARLATGDRQGAAESFAAALALVEDTDSRPFAISARSELEKLKAAGIATESP